jgi:hypothetical protein
MTLKGFCNCCARRVELVCDETLGECVCRVCRSYDVRRDTVRKPRAMQVELVVLATLGRVCCPENTVTVLE